MRRNRRVTLRPKPWGSALRTARLYTNGVPTARGFVNAEGVHWVILYNVVSEFSIDAEGKILEWGYTDAAPF